jgi:hypothetical protein
MDGFFPLCPYLLIYRAEEAAGPNPAKSTGIPTGMGILLLGAYISKNCKIPFGVKRVSNILNLIYDD